MNFNGISVEVSEMIVWDLEDGKKNGNDIRIGNEYFFVELDHSHIRFFRYSDMKRSMWMFQEWEKDNSFIEVIDTYGKYLEFLRLVVVEYLIKHYYGKQKEGTVFTDFLIEEGDG